MLLLILSSGFIGITLIFLEFFTPGGLLAILGTIAILLGFLLSIFYQSWIISCIYLFCCLILSGYACYIAIQKIKKSKNTLCLSTDQSENSLEKLSSNLIHETGITLSELKPSGFVLIKGSRYQAISESGFIEKNQPIQITQIRSFSVVVTNYIGDNHG